MGLILLAALAAGLLYLIGNTFSIIGSHIGPDGRVPSAEAFGLTALLLSFREVIGAIRGIWDNDTRNKLTDKLADAQPAIAPPPQSAVDAAGQVAGAAVDAAREIEAGS
ncbi:hypothetical protein [Sphingobium amiense]|nr:hypothetical protein [Sphingobium amiense]